MDLLLRASIVKYPRLGGLNNRHLLAHSAGGRNFMIKVPTELVSGKAPVPDQPFYCLLTWTFSPCVKDISPVGIRLNMTSFSLNYLLEGSISKYNYTGG